jgi:hypothetical protein
MDTRNEYRIVPTEYESCPWLLEFRYWWSPWKWRYIGMFKDEEASLARAKIHAGEGTKYLGRLP